MAAKKKVTKKIVVKRKTVTHKSTTRSRSVWVVPTLIVLCLIIAGLSYKPMVQNETPIQLAIAPTKMPFDFSAQKFMVDDQAVVLTQMMKALNLAENRSAAVLVDSSNGSGTFYYLAGAMRGSTGEEIFSQPMLLGDRIKVTSVVVDNPGAEDNGVITVKYFDRPVGAAMSDEPTQEVTKKYAFEENGNLIEVLE